MDEIKNEAMTNENTEVEETCTDVACTSSEVEEAADNNNGLAIAVIGAVGTLAVVGGYTVATKVIVPGAKKVISWGKNVIDAAKLKKSEPVVEAEAKEVDEEAVEAEEADNKDSKK